MWINILINHLRRQHIKCEIWNTVWSHTEYGLRINQPVKGQNEEFLIIDWNSFKDYAFFAPGY